MNRHVNVSISLCSQRSTIYKVSEAVARATSVCPLGLENKKNSNDAASQFERNTGVKRNWRGNCHNVFFFFFEKMETLTWGLRRFQETRKMSCSPENYLGPSEQIGVALGKPHGYSQIDSCFRFRKRKAATH